MIKITIEGPQGEGKTRIGDILTESLKAIGITYLRVFEGDLKTESNIFDVLIIEKQTN